MATTLQQPVLGLGRVGLPTRMKIKYVDRDTRLTSIRERNAALFLISSFFAKIASRQRILHLMESPMPSKMLRARKLGFLCVGCA